MSTGHRPLSIAHSCAFVRSRLASLTADPQPRHREVTAQPHCSCYISHNVGRDAGKSPLHPPSSSPSAHPTAVLGHIRSAESKKQEPGAGALSTSLLQAAIFSSGHMGIAASRGRRVLEHRDLSEST